jgi:amidase
MAEAIDVLKKQGAVIVDPANLPSVVEKDPTKNVTVFSDCRTPKGQDADCSMVFKYGMKRDFNKWLASLGPTAPVKTLAELRMWNINHISGGAIRYGQGTLDVSDEEDLEADRARYEADRARDIDLSRTHGFDAVMKANNLDALMFPAAGGTAVTDRAGYPGLTVPFGTVPNDPQTGPPLPKGFDAKPARYGVSFAGMACSEPKLIEIGYAFEQATKRRVPPASTP